MGGAMDVVQGTHRVITDLGKSMSRPKASLRWNAGRAWPTRT